MKKLGLILAATLLPLVANAETIQTFSPRAATNGTATLTREASLYRININAEGLVPGHAYTLIVATWNNPPSCKLTTFPACDFTVDSAGLGGNPFATPTLMFLTGGRAGPSGAVTFNGKVEKGAVGLTGRQVYEGTGTYNMAGAHVQVLIRDMDTAGKGGVDVFKQVSDIYAGCSGSGGTGTNSCGPVQIVTFVP